jgi:RNA polymerase sigma factor (sigma-70 family)
VGTTDYNLFSDSDLILEYKSTNNKEIVGHLFEKYTHLVFGVCMKYLRSEEDARDALMQIFEKLLEDLKKHEIVQFKHWLHTVSKNHCLMQIRSGKSVLARQREFKAEVENLHAAVADPVQDSAADDAKTKEERLEKLEKALLELNEDQRNCIQLFFLKEKSYQEIVQLTGYSMNDVKSHLQNGKRNIKLYFTRP